MSDESSGVFAGNGPPPPAPGAVPPPVPGAILPASALGRFAFLALVPAITLPFLIVAASFFRTFLAPPSSYDVDYIVIAVYCFMLIGSNAINTWLLGRHPLTWQQKALPHGTAVVLVILWGLEVLGIVLGAVSRLGGWHILIAFALIVISVVVFFFAVVRRRAGIATVPETAVGLSTYAAVLGWGYLAVVLLGVAVSVAAGPSTGPLVGIGAALGLGLPWSWPLSALGYLFTLVFFNAWAIGYVAFALVGLSVVANVVLVVLIMFRPAFRVRFVNWFFKLHGSGDPQTTIRTFAPPMPPEPPASA